MQIVPSQTPICVLAAKTPEHGGMTRTTANPAPTAAHTQPVYGCSPLNTVTHLSGAARLVAEPNGTASPTTTKGAAGGSGDRTTRMAHLRRIHPRRTRSHTPTTPVGSRHSPRLVDHQQNHHIVAERPTPHRPAGSRRDSSRRQTTQLHHGRE